MQLNRCFIISLFRRDVLFMILALFSSYGVVLNTIIGISDNIVLRIALT